MSSTIAFAPGNYRFVPGVFQYSAGVVAEPGYRIERVRFQRPVALAEGFDRIAAILTAAGRPLTAFCACELRSPAPFDEVSFAAFNRIYVGTLEKWGVFDGVTNPVARSNVCPEIDPPSTPSFYAFCYTVPDAAAAPSFVVAGSGEAPEGKGSYRDHTIRLGDTSPDGLRAKARWVLGEMENRMGAMGFGWKDTTVSQLYTVHDVHPFLADELVRRGAMAGGLTWHFNRPPVRDLDYEMDCRAISVERIVAA
ncbi:2-amino-5-chloromuconate deaminase CnbZ [Lacisediminimonas profundi]|uniref:2-amino-5-chloromuconate deaminase CnbZ n=1 Tax=Lacisediminimonas profundi TaxID=2603856 RepID=UPI00124AF362|nr:hypothetical protein [Lacisediminimonas profundi]